MNALQRLPRNEEAAMLNLVRENGMDASKLRCEHTRQQGHGRTREGYPISYDLIGLNP